MSTALIIPHWPAPANVAACSTTRHGGVSLAPWHSLNLGTHCGDNPAHVAENRQRLAQLAGFSGQPVWLDQVHGTRVLTVTTTPQAPRHSLPHQHTPDQPAQSPPSPPRPQADASYTHTTKVICTVMTADCLPVLFCDDSGQQIAAAHAGWRGLCAGILERTVACFENAPAHILAWLGPAIGPQAFEVGDEVRTAFLAHDRAAACAFRPHGNKYLADLYQLARQRLHAAGVHRIYGGDHCTWHESQHFFSWRRDGKSTGRMASLIWRRQ